MLILAIIAAAGAAIGLIAINSFKGASVQANQGGRSGAQKWEYCAIISAGRVGSNFGERAAATIHYYQAGGVREETVEFVPDLGKSVNWDGREALAKALAKLGDEGWEMVLKEPAPENRTRDTFYFKRPKQ